MEEIRQGWMQQVDAIIHYHLFSIGNATITPLNIFYIILFSALLIFLSNRLKNLLLARVLGHTKLDVGAQQAIGTILRYVIITVGFLVILQTVGIDLTTGLVFWQRELSSFAGLGADGGNVYVTDGACMTSTSTQNPSLTYMALSARAVDHAVRSSKM